MCHPILFGFFFGVVLAKLLRRWRHGGGGCGGGGCGDGMGGHRRGARWRWGHHGGGFHAPSTGRPLEELLRGLDLNQRQRDEASPILGLASQHLGARGPRLESALFSVAAERFDRTRAESAVADVAPEVRRDLLDGLEHLHNILIPEQREQLRTQLLGTPAASTNPGQGGGTAL